MSPKKDPQPQTQLTRMVSLVAIMFAVLAPVIFVLTFFLVSIGLTQAGRAFSPFGIVATAIGLVASIWAVTLPRTRVVGITTLLVILPCTFLAALGVVSLLSA